MMTPSELKYQVQLHHPESHFFDSETMRFFGDRMSNYGVCAATIDTWSADGVEVWELYRKRPVKNGLCESDYFRRDTFEQTFAKVD